MAIFFEIIATSLLNMSDGFKKLTPSLLCVPCYCICFYLLSLSLKNIPLGIAYAVWSGVGIVVLSIIGIVVFHQKLNMGAYIGIFLILIGTIITYHFINVSNGGD
jgi:small multidrug resistance pump